MLTRELKGRIRKDNETPFMVLFWIAKSQSETDVSRLVCVNITVV